jgi:MurNAc alpha-1-phosphate uridylyltransferase
MLLAAGRGERMGRITEDRPKPLLEVGTCTLIERNLMRIAAAGIDEVVINLSYRGDQIRSALGTGDRYGLRIIYSQEPEPPLETAGGIVEARDLLGPGRFLLVNADVFSDFDFTDLLHGEPASELGSEPGPELVLVPNPAHNPDGDFGLDDTGLVVDAAPRLTYAGIAILDMQFFTALNPGRHPLKPVLDAAIARGELTGRIHGGVWVDVGTPERLEQARTLAAAA